MKNVEIAIDGDILTIRVDLTQEQGLSASGKTMILGTTSGNYAVPNSGDPAVVVGLNVYRKLPRGAA